MPDHGAIDPDFDDHNPDEHHPAHPEQTNETHPAHDHAGHAHAHGVGGLGSVLGAVFHAHRHEVSFDAALETSAIGIRALWTSLAVLGLTAVIQLAIAVQSGSVGLLADTIHNFSDALTALPLWLAFMVGRRPPNRRYTYGYGRAEDVAGLVIVVVIVASAGVALWESYRRIAHPVALHQIDWVMAAAVVGFLGNEAVSLIRLRAGRRIGSAALEADGDHARIDGLTSLGVLVGAVAVALGFPIADPIVGLLISVAILVVSKEAAVAMWHRLMDAVDPALAQQAETVARSTPGVVGVHNLRLRWLGHQLLAELHVVVDEDIPISQGHRIAEDVRERLCEALPRLGEVSVHLDPCGHARFGEHGMTTRNGERDG